MATDRADPISVRTAGAGRAQVHVLPCHIEYDGPAALERYWRVEPLPAAEVPPDAVGDAFQLAYFRGCRLLGRRVALPEGYIGCIVPPTDVEQPPREAMDLDDESDDDADDAPPRVWQATDAFDALTVWEQDDVPGTANAWASVDGWIAFAEQLCGDDI
ncbi:ribonuclease H2, subunit C [Dipodascopsis tothii]|uniref:ribonuclease H2, subunit C n=1 Tax=Dipodascopsis tothii TaxID=44089 RepID=UPI0034CD52CA